MDVLTGYIPFMGYKTWYRIVGKCEEGKFPLLVLHGGPGSNHSYLKSLDDIAKTGHAVIYYDQLGCGMSKVPDGCIDYSTELWQEEVNVVREALGLKKVHILGHSWGGMLAMQYAISQPNGVISLIIASSPASIPLWVSEAKRLLSYLPKEMQKAIEIGESTGNYDYPGYKEGYDEYYRRHVCMLDPYPDYIKKSFDDEPECYLLMQGHSEFVVTGRLKDWDVTDQLHTISIPTLVTSGLMDEATPLIAKAIHDRIPNCRWELLNGTHMVHAEEREKYNNLIVNYITETEGN